MWTDCPSDCSTLEYCLSGSLALVLASPALVARPSRCSGDECGNEADPRAHARWPPSNPPDSRLPGSFPLEGSGGGTGAPRCGETDCERRRSATPGMSLDISCLSCACPTSSFRIFSRSSSPLDSIPDGTVAGVLETSDADSSSDRANCRHHRPPKHAAAASAAASPLAFSRRPPGSSKGRSFLRSRGRFDAKWSRNCALSDSPRSPAAISRTGTG